MSDEMMRLFSSKHILILYISTSNFYEQGEMGTCTSCLWTCKDITAFMLIMFKKRNTDSSCRYSAGLNAGTGDDS